MRETWWKVIGIFLSLCHCLQSLEITGQVTGEVSVGGTLSLNCSTGVQNLESCAWTSPTDNHFDIYSGNVELKPSGECILKLDDVKEEDFGTWRCRMKAPEQSIFQEVHLSGKLVNSGN